MWFFLSLYFAFWTAINVSLTKKLSRDTDVLPLSLILTVVNLPFLFLILIYQGVPQVPASFYWYLLTAGILDAFALYFSTKSIKIAPISLVSPIASFNPLFVTILALFFLNEKPTLTKFLGILLIVIGSYLLNVTDAKAGLMAPLKKLITNRGVQFALLCNLIWAITPLFQKPAILATTPRSPIYPVFVETLIVSSILILIIAKDFSKSLVVVRRNVWMLLLIGLFTSLAQVSAFIAFSQANVGYVAAIFKLSVIFSILLGATVYKEEKIQERLLGASVMIIGTILLIS